MRAVFDTNVVISALVFGRRLVWLRHAWAAGSVIPIVCRETVAELLRVLTYPIQMINVERHAFGKEEVCSREVIDLYLPLPDEKLPGVSS